MIGKYDVSLNEFKSHNNCNFVCVFSISNARIRIQYNSDNAINVK